MASPVDSFRGLLSHLATLIKNTVRLPGSHVAFEKVSPQPAPSLCHCFPGRLNRELRLPGVEPALERGRVPTEGLELARPTGAG